MYVSGMMWGQAEEESILGNVRNVSYCESDDNDFEYFSDDDKCDFDDLDHKFLFSSLEEDAMLSEFT